MKRILLIGNGGREHAIAEAIKKSPQESEIYCFATAKNPGIEDLSNDYLLTDSLKNFGDLKLFTEQHPIDFAFIGPEDPLAAGIVDFLEELNIACIGPRQVNAQLEASKAFTRNLVEKYKINANPAYKNFTNKEGLRQFMEELDGQFVVKYDSLKGGKGVKVVGDHLDGIDDGVEYAEECIDECGRVVIEEKLIGEEFSLISFVDGETVIDCPAVQDHKRAYEGDTGPNTGGMGSYSDQKNSLPFVSKEDLQAAHEINVKVTRAIKQETGIPYKGIMYGGFIITKKGVKLIEYNIRFGDPEAMNILPVLKTDFITICEAIINSTLNEIDVEWESQATVCKYIVPEGYPDKPIKGENIKINWNQIPQNVKIYFASVDGSRDNLRLCGSRAIGVVGLGSDLIEAEKNSEAACQLISGPVFHRRDIGTAPLIQRRLDQMKLIRA